MLAMYIKCKWGIYMRDEQYQDIAPRSYSVVPGTES